MAETWPDGYPAWLAASACLWLSCLFLALILHEAGHALTAALLGHGFELHLAHVENTAATARDQILIAAGGPVLSLLQGVAFCGLFLVLPERAVTAATVSLMLAGLGFATAFGYMLTTPFTAHGDMGKIAVLLGLPGFVRVAIMLAGAVGLTLLARYAAFAHLSLLPVGWRGLSPEKALVFGAILPWLVAVPVVVWAITLQLGLFSALFPVFAGSYLLIGLIDRPVWPEVTVRAQGLPLIAPALFAMLMLALALALRQRK